LLLISRPKRRLGQNFLINRRIAEVEAVHARGMRVVEMGPGYGILTTELCKHAKSVVAVELDGQLYKNLLNTLAYGKFKLINGDFFDPKVQARIGEADILISNIPYNMSSAVLEWLSRKGMPAVLCLQKEFVDRMLASPGTREYSSLSVMASLCFKTTRIMRVSKVDFRPVPKVDSVIVYLKPTGVVLTNADRAAMGVLMQHKRRTVRAALRSAGRDSRIDSERLAMLAETLEDKNERVFTIPPLRLLAITRAIGRSVQEEKI